MDMKLIPDKELDSLEKEDLLGTLPYVDTLHEIVKKCDTPFNIGLLAGWGGGKSSIIETLIKKIHAGNEAAKSDDIIVFKYDAWKYSEDPFRRTFIIELVKELEVKGFENLDSLLYDNASTETEGQTKFSPNFFVKYMFLAPIAFWLIWLLNVQTDTKIIITGISAISGMVLFLLKEMFTTYKITIHKSKVIEPEKFESIFEEIVDKVTKRKRSKWLWIKEVFGGKVKKSPKKLLIVVDNIDRCHSELVVQLLLTIKNFLDKENVVFILPVDESGVTFFLKDKNQNASEFLRKIFNSTIRIKHYSNDEMFDYSWKLVETHGLDKIGISRDVVHMACQEYTTNPRKIIQFLNNFQMEIFLVKEQEKVRYLNDSQVSSNFSFLAKLSIIREEWSDLYQKLFERNHLMKEIDKAISENMYKENEVRDYYIESRKEMPILDERQYLFFQRTRGIVAIGSIEPFFVNRDLLKDIPDSVNELISGSDWIKIKKLLEDDSIDFVKILDAIKKKNDADIVKRKLYSTTGNAIFRLINQIIIDEKFGALFQVQYVKNYEYRFIEKLVDSIEFDAELRKIPQNELMPLTRWLHDRKSNTLTDKVLLIVEGAPLSESEKTHLEFIRAFILNFKVETDYLSKVSKRFCAILQNNPAFLGEIDEILSDEQCCKYLFSTDFINHNIDTVDAQTAMTNPIKIKFLNTLKDFSIMTEAQINSVALKFITYLSNNNEWNYLTAHFEVLQGYFKPFIDANSLNQFRSIIETKHNHFIQQILAGNVNAETQLCYEKYVDVLYEAIQVSEQDATSFINKIHAIGFTTSHPNLVSKIAVVFEKITRNPALKINVLSHIVQCCNAISDYARREELVRCGSEEVVKHEQVDVGNFGALVDCAFRQYFENPEASQNFIIEFLNTICSNSETITPLTEKIKSLPNIEHKKEILKLADKVAKPEIVGDIAKDIVLNSKDTTIFKGNIIFVINNYSNGKAEVKDSLINALKTEQGPNLNTLIDLVVMERGNLDKEVIDTAVSQLKGYLTSKTIIDIQYAFSKLEAIRIDDIEKKTANLLVQLIGGIDVELDGEASNTKTDLITKFSS